MFNDPNKLAVDTNQETFPKPTNAVSENLMSGAIKEAYSSYRRDISRRLSMSDSDLGKLSSVVLPLN